MSMLGGSSALPMIYFSTCSGMNKWWYESGDFPTPKYLQVVYEKRLFVWFCATLTWRAQTERTLGYGQIWHRSGTAEHILKLFLCAQALPYKNLSAGSVERIFMAALQKTGGRRFLLLQHVWEKPTPAASLDCSDTAHIVCLYCAETIVLFMLCTALLSHFTHFKIFTCLWHIRVKSWSLTLVGKSDNWAQFWVKEWGCIEKHLGMV